MKQVIDPKFNFKTGDKFFNIEFKAVCSDIGEAEKKLQKLNPLFSGLDHQLDTYFNAVNGRLKIREGNIENALIWYSREDISGVRRSDIIMYKTGNISELKNILAKSLGIKCVIDKARKIYFAENVKIHLDEVKGLGSFLEVEAINISEKFSEKTLHEQCRKFIEMFEVKNNDFIDKSYSDMVNLS